MTTQEHTVEEEMVAEDNWMTKMMRSNDSKERESATGIGKRSRAGGLDY